MSRSRPGSARLRFMTVSMAATLVCIATSANAGGRFGTDERIIKIQDIAATGPNGEHLFLGHKISTFNIFAPAYMTDDGYVIGVVGTDRYIPLDADKISGLQRSGQLPMPLPTYEITWVDWLFGYMLWALLPFIGLWAVYDMRRGAKHVEQSQLLKVGDPIQIGYSRRLGFIPRSGTAMEFDSEGFRGVGTADRLILWKDVVGLRKYNVQAGTFIEVKTVPGSPPPFMGGVEKLFRDPDRINIPASKLAMHEDALIDLMQRHIANAQAAHASHGAPAVNAPPAPSLSI
jgi:hypothetical protein